MHVIVSKSKPLLFNFIVKSWIFWLLVVGGINLSICFMVVVDVPSGCSLVWFQMPWRCGSRPQMAMFPLLVSLRTFSPSSFFGAIRCQVIRSLAGDEADESRKRREVPSVRQSENLERWDQVYAFWGRSALPLPRLCLSVFKSMKRSSPFSLFSFLFLISQAEAFS